MPSTQLNVTARAAVQPPALRLLAWLLACCCAPASAAISDTIHPFVSVSYTHDDNLLRLSDDTPGYTGQRSDSSKEIDYGLLLERPIGQQVVTGRFKLTKVKFDYFKQLDYDGKDMMADVNWHLGTHLDGNLGATYEQTLASFSDFHSSERNLRTQRRAYLDANWRFHPSWRLRSGFSRQKFSYELLAQRYSDRTEDVSYAGVDYLASSGSRIGLVARHLKGAYPYARTFGSLRLDDGYSQDEVKLDVDWKLTGTTQLRLLGGWARREHNFYTERDASGLNGRTEVRWTPLGHIAVVATAWREFAAVESTYISNSLNKGASVAPTWEITSKVQANLQLKQEKRDFSTVTGLVAPFSIYDKTRTTSAGLTFAPRPTMQIGISAYHEQRSGNAALIGSGSYRTNGYSINASAQF